MSLENHIHSTLKDSDSNIRAIPMCKIDNDVIVTYAEMMARDSGKMTKKTSLENLKDNRVKGELSATSLRKIKKHLHAWAKAVYEHNKSLEYYEQNQRAHLIMLTLTLSADTTKNDKELKRELYGRMIEKLRIKHKVNYYFIRYESQENGRLHAHIIIDKYIDKKEIQASWNKLQNRIGLIDEFEKKYKHRQPPSTHIKEITATTETINYLLDYVLKKEQYRKIEGRLYGISDKLKEIETSSYMIDNETDVFLQKCIAHPESDVYYGDFFTIIYLKEKFYREFLPDALRYQQHRYYLSVYDFLYNPSRDYDYEILSAYGREKKEKTDNDKALVQFMKKVPETESAKQLLLFDQNEAFYKQSINLFLEYNC